MGLVLREPCPVDRFHARGRSCTLDKRTPTGSRPFRPLARVSTLFVRGKNGAREDRPERKGSAAQNTYVTVTNLSR